MIFREWQSSLFIKIKHQSQAVTFFTRPVLMKKFKKKEESEVTTKMCDCKTTDSRENILDGVLAECGFDAGNLITVLQKAQDIYGYLPIEVIYYVADKLGITPAKVMGVATFYAQFRLEPVGKYLIMLCKGTACHVNGAESISAAVTNELGIENGQTTKDGLFTLKTVACLGCCSISPVMMINDEAFGSLTPEKARNILKDFRKASSEEKGGLA